jgi:phosphate transport system substrate-binding protein
MTPRVINSPVWRVATGLALVALVSAACGSSSSKSSAAVSATTTTAVGPKVDCAPGTISGAGSTFVQTIAQQWVKDYEAACSGSTINYQGVGSGAGIAQFTAGTVDFGASDVTMKATEQQAAEAKLGPVLHIPWTAGAVAVEFNVRGLSTLQLSPATLAGVFAGTITKWNDPAIAADNAGATLPTVGIQVVHRSDSSGTTNAFTSYLTAVAPTVWTVGSGKDVRWPTGQGAKGSDGVTAVVHSTDGAIGYAELSFAKANSLTTASIKNPAGQFVAPGAEGVAAALKGATVPDDLKVKVNFAPPDPAAYPISTVTWALVPTKPSDAAKAKLLKDFLTYVLSAGQQSAPGLFYAPLPSDLLARAQAAVATIQA